MELQEAIKHIHDHATDILKPDNQSRNLSKPKGYVCPICGSGSHSPTGTGITTKDGIHFTCWAGCYSNLDIIDILAKRDGHESETPIEKLKNACKVFNISLDKSNHTTPLKAQETEKDFSGLIYEALQQIDNCDYLDKRGISKELQKKMRIGYLPEYILSNTRQSFPALIIPIGNHAYTVRSLGNNGRKYYSIGPKGIYNIFDLHCDTRPVFVVANEIDCLSFLELGFKSIALRSANSNHEALIQEIQEISPEDRPLLILALDNDPAGTKGTLTLAEKLQQANINYYLPKSSELYGTHKDANECLVNEREALKERAEHLQQPPEELYSETSAKYFLTSFLEDIENNRNRKAIDTGFNNLNEALDGGLFAGLYVIGAISSLGKTTFTLQMADNIAKAGHDVLIFSLEMAKKELIAKSISRISLQEMKPGQDTEKLARSTRNLLSNINRNTKEQMTVIKHALQVYGEYADNIFIVEGLGDVTIDRIKNTIAQHVIYRKKTPVVIIDYLQIIAPLQEDKHCTDKQNTDKAVLELKRISRDYETPVIAISSFNRDNYKAAVNMSSFKESGAIEYSSDVLIGMQLKGAGDKNADLEELKKKTPREVELKILKNRNGRTGEIIDFEFYSKYNDFEER